MKALILAAGYATRLYPLTKHFPKPLLKVKRRPIISYITDKLSRIDDIDEIIVVTNNKFMPFFKRWAALLKSVKPVRLVNDLTRSQKDRLGAIGDMEFVINKEKINDDLLVIGGDNLFDDELDEFMKFTRQKQGATVIGIYDLKDKKKAVKYGVVRLNRANRIVDFQEKPGSPLSSIVAMCLYFFPKARLDLIKRYFAKEQHKRDATGFYIDWLRRKSDVYGFVFSGKWYDIGHRSFYEQAKTAFAA